MRATTACAVSLLVLLEATAARAQETCPTEIPASSEERRARAKEWFSKAEAAEAGNDPVTAVKAYQCSLRMVPHAFTAFNLARLAEKNGDLELAVESYDTYLKLAPEAPDRVVVTARMTTLSERIAQLRKAQEADPGTPLTPSEGPAPLGEYPRNAEPLPALSPPADRSFDTEAPPGLETQRRRHPMVYILGGVAIGAAIGGVMLNLGARGKMADCRNLAMEGLAQEAASACDAARPRAYASYALLGLAGLTAIADTVVLLMGSRPTENRVTLVPLSDGATFMAQLRF